MNGVMGAARRQLTLFLPGGARAPVEAVRARIDPRQHARIAAHVTLCREDELAPWPEVVARLDALPPIALVMRFGSPQRLPDGCILLRPISGVDAYRALRRTLLGVDAREHGAHVTLLHPRHATGDASDLGDLARSIGELTVTFDAVSCIEQQAGGEWRELGRYGCRR